MNTKEIAEALDGSEYPLRIPVHVIEAAKAAGIVIVYGDSDDIMSFAGAVRDEVGCYNGGSAQIDTEGLLPNRDDIESDAELDKYFARRKAARNIEALWSEEGDYAWAYRTDIPHHCFDVEEDGEPFCRGIVFNLADASK